MNRGTKVLVVDDDQRMARTTCDILRIKGYSAIEAHTGEESLERIRSGLPDCVLMDIKMPGTDGMEILKKIKIISPGLPVVLMSAYVTEELAKEARRQGAYGVLTKPIDFQMVLSFLSLLRREESILIVDDDPIFCKTLEDVLESRGYAVETERDPANVLGHLEQSYKLVVLLDLKLGEIDGVDVLKAIRDRYPTKPVVLVTGRKDDMNDSIQRGLRIGAYTYIYKPLEAEALFKTIMEITKKKIQNVLVERFSA